MTTYPPEEDFIVSNNATWDQRFSAVDSNNSVFNLTNMSLRAQFRATADGPDVVLDASTANNFILIYNAAGGNWGFAISALAASGIKAGTYVYDVLATSTSDPRVWRIQKGNVTVDEGVTR